MLLRRYGVVCWRLLEREAPRLPPWRELLREYQRLEARGEIRGGRFLGGVVGQQFALPEAVAALRSVRKRAHDGAMIAVSASDPLNLLGGILAGDKVPRQPGARLLCATAFRSRRWSRASSGRWSNCRRRRARGADGPAARSGRAFRPVPAPGSRPMADPLGLHS